MVKMGSVREISVIVNGNRSQQDEVVDVTWQEDRSVSEPSSPDIGRNETVQLDANEDDNDSIDRELDFILEHAKDADPEFVHSLLHSQADNPHRLETMMTEMLDIPNAQNLIDEYRKNTLKVGEKRPTQNPEVDPIESKKKKSETDGYLYKIREMFPDADDMFLIDECKQLESWEDCTRFINTVMISGVYPKAKAAELNPTDETPKQNNFVSDNVYKSIYYSSEDEVSSSGFSESPKRRKQTTKNIISASSTDSSPRVFGSRVEPPEVVELHSDNTEPYEPPDERTLQELYTHTNLTVNTIDIDPVVATSWEIQIDEDVDNILAKKFGNKPVKKGEETSERHELTDMNNPQPGPSGLQKRITPIKEETNKTVDELAARARPMRANPPSKRMNDDFQRPSTSKEEVVIEPVAGPSQSSDVVSSPEVSTTSQTAKESGPASTESTEEAEDSSKVSEEWVNEQTASLVKIFPNTDPSYLRNEVANMNGTAEAVNAFVVQKLDKNDMPSRADYERRKELQELQIRYTKNFSIQDFLKAVPEPWKYFTVGNRDCQKYKDHSLCYLKSTFRKHYVRDILDVFSSNECNLYVTYKQLKKIGMKRRSSRRSEFECNISRPTTLDIQFLQEVAFIENEEKILEFLENEIIAKQEKFDEAKLSGRLLECQCCFDPEVMVEDIVYCPSDHPFCKECVIKSVEVEMGNGKYQFECLADCDQKFSLAALQGVLKPELFSKVIQAIQLEEIRAAGIEDLVQCPFCSYATIMPPESKVMTCLNPECLKESCRLCKELSHVPLKCDEVEKSEEIKMRTYIENKMTEALVRTCYNCGKKFVKEDGCNKMTCTCGAKMCYICRQRVTSYSHFNGQGGTDFYKCPLYSTNDELHVDLVKKVGEAAKKEILEANPEKKLIHDPTTVMPKRSHDRIMPGMNVGAGLNHGLRALRQIFDTEEDIEVDVENYSDWGDSDFDMDDDDYDEAEGANYMHLDYRNRDENQNRNRNLSQNRDQGLNRNQSRNRDGSRNRNQSQNRDQVRNRNQNRNRHHSRNRDESRNRNQSRNRHHSRNRDESRNRHHSRNRDESRNRHHSRNRDESRNRHHSRNRDESRNRNHSRNRDESRNRIQPPPLPRNRIQPQPQPSRNRDESRNRHQSLNLNVNRHQPGRARVAPPEDDEARNRHCRRRQSPEAEAGNHYQNLLHRNLHNWAPRRHHQNNNNHHHNHHRHHDRSRFDS